ncbi:hypothetical protein ZOSMA_118G00090 [Zostera marina]|uniref:Uncharacterized protein n=1 Tax=Zostera marina TaxID=29655 RepID=A0A0K9Q3R2_ZOSMR|nr:hypothetical protein ZOSMA_118G00090 [Zostera marina]
MSQKSSSLTTVIPSKITIHLYFPTITTLFHFLHFFVSSHFLPFSLPKSVVSPVKCSSNDVSVSAPLVFLVIFAGLCFPYRRLSFRVRRVCFRVRRLSCHCAWFLSSVVSHLALPINKRIEMDRTRGSRGRVPRPSRGRGGRGGVPPVLGELEMVAPLNFDCSEYIGSQNLCVLRRRRSGYTVVEPAGTSNIPPLLAALIVEGVGRKARRPVAVASTSTPVSTAPLETPSNPVSSLLPRPDEYVIGLSSPFATCKAEKPLSKKKRATRKIKRGEVGTSNVSPLQRTAIQSPEKLDSFDSSTIHCNQFGNVKNDPICREVGDANESLDVVDVVVRDVHADVDDVDVPVDDVDVPVDDVHVFPVVDVYDVPMNDVPVPDVPVVPVVDVYDVPMNDVPVPDVPVSDGPVVPVPDVPIVPVNDVLVLPVPDVHVHDVSVVPMNDVPVADEVDVLEDVDPIVPEGDEGELPQEHEAVVPEGDSVEVPQERETVVFEGNRVEVPQEYELVVREGEVPQEPEPVVPEGDVTEVSKVREPVVPRGDESEVPQDSEPVVPEGDEYEVPVDGEPIAEAESGVPKKESVDEMIMTNVIEIAFSFAIDLSDYQMTSSPSDKNSPSDDCIENSNGPISEDTLFEDMQVHLRYNASVKTPLSYHKSVPFTPKLRTTPKHLRKKMSDYWRIDEFRVLQIRTPKTTATLVDGSPKTPEGVDKVLEYSPRFWDSVIRHYSQIETNIGNEEHHEVEIEESEYEKSGIDVGEINEDRVNETLMFEEIDGPGCKKKFTATTIVAAMVRTLSTLHRRKFTAKGLFKKRFAPNIHIPDWNDFFREIRLMVDNDMLNKIAYVPLFTKSHWHYLVINEPECVITHLTQKGSRKIIRKRHVAWGTTRSWTSSN